MGARIEYTVVTRVKKILELLDKFPAPSHSSPYQRIEYVKLAVSNHFFYSLVRFTRPFFIVFNIDGFDSLILPLSKSVFKKKYRFFGDRAGFGYLDIIHRENLSNIEIEDCFELLKKDFFDSTFYFDRLKESSSAYAVLKKMSTPRPSESCVVLNLPENYDSYFNSLSKNAKQNYRTAVNRIEKSSKRFYISHIGSKDITRDVLKQMIDLYNHRQKQKYNPTFSILDSLFISRFDIGFISTRQLNFSEAHLIYIDDQLAGFMCCLSDGDELIVPRLAISDIYSFYSPGVLLLVSTIKYIYSCRSIKKIDMVQGQENYKLQIGGRVRKCYSFVFPENGLR